jgi:hypothetical protein
MKPVYCITLKKNHKKLFEDISAYFQDSNPTDFAVFEHHDKGHGRIEKRVCRILNEVTWLKNDHQWPGLTSLVEITRMTEFTNSKKQSMTDTRFYS